MKPDPYFMIQTPSQTIGPYFAQGLLRDDAASMPHILFSEKTTGERIHIIGSVTDGQGQPVTDALIEIWQADAHGRYHHPIDNREAPIDQNFWGHGRAATDENGHYGFETIKPGSLPGQNDTLQAPHINVILFARGLTSHLFTRIYFEDEAANRKDPVLKSIVDKSRRHTLVGRRVETGQKIVYRFDIHLQGERETVFFDA